MLELDYPDNICCSSVIHNIYIYVYISIFYFFSSYRNNRHWLFRGLEDPNEENSEDFLKPTKYPSVRKLNLKAFKGVKGDLAPLGSPADRLNGETDSTDAPSLTTPVSPLGDSTPLRTSGPPSHENSPTPDIIKVISNILFMLILTLPNLM